MERNKDMTNAAEKLEEIQTHLATKGNKVMVCTHLRATTYDHRHIGMFKANTGGLFVQRGRAWDCIDYCAIRFGSLRSA